MTGLGIKCFHIMAKLWVKSNIYGERMVEFDNHWDHEGFRGRQKHKIVPVKFIKKAYRVKVAEYTRQHSFC